MSETIKNRRELLFCYDITNANPNGDPLDMNKPRIDEESGLNLVTDVRLKRTIRDYLYEYKGFNGSNGRDIFVREKQMESGGIQDGKTRAKDFGESADEILAACIDIRLFGGVLPLAKDSITFTGPTQFKMGHSLHRVELKHIQGTGAFASTAGAKQRTFREEYILPYSFIAFHGIVNQHAARHTGLTEEDFNLLLEAIWFGTKNLISRSKFGQVPRMLVVIEYNDDYFIGDLDHKIRLSDVENEVQIRKPSDFTLDVSSLVVATEEAEEHIARVSYQIHPDLRVKPDLPESWVELQLE